MDQKEKTRFRSSKVWKEFRLLFIKQTGGLCEMCGTKYTGKRLSMLQLHHLDPAHYTLLEPNRFKLCCQPCHDLIERMYVKFNGKNSNLIPYQDKWNDLLKGFLPYSKVNK